MTERDDSVTLECGVEANILVAADVAIPLGIIATELITNAVKYAFPPPACGTIRAEARRVDPERVELRVLDDGQGMSGSREGSLGFGLVETLVRQIGGEMNVQGQPGVAVTIVFPVASRPAETMPT